jgi:hypothetical protein
MAGRPYFYSKEQPSSSSMFNQVMKTLDEIKEAQIKLEGEDETRDYWRSKYVSRIDKEIKYDNCIYVNTGFNDGDARYIAIKAIIGHWIDDDGEMCFAVEPVYEDSKLDKWCQLDDFMHSDAMKEKIEDYLNMNLKGLPLFK